MATLVTNRNEKAGERSATAGDSLSICLVGGIYGKDEAYRAKIRMAPETLLETGLRSEGHQVVTVGHRQNVDCSGVDVVHVHHLGYGAARLATSGNSLPFIFTSHDPLAMSRMLSPMRRLALKFVMSRADAVVALSTAESRFQSANYCLDGAIHTVIPNGVSTEHYRYARNNLAGRGRPWRLLFVGQLVETKGVNRLIHALATLPPNTELSLAFHVDTLQGRLEELTRRLGVRDRVHFLGRKTPDELRELYQNADLFVLPSFGEALPSVVTEAMFCGTPIIATDVGGVKDQLGEYGVVVSPGDTNALAQAIHHVLSQYDEFSSRSQAMSEYAVRRFSIATMVERHLELYRSVLDSKMARRRNQHSKFLTMAARVGVRALCKTS